MSFALYNLPFFFSKCPFYFLSANWPTSEMSHWIAVLRYTAKMHQIWNLCLFHVACFLLRHFALFLLSFSLLFLDFLSSSAILLCHGLLPPTVIKKIVAGTRWCVLCLLFSLNSVCLLCCYFWQSSFHASTHIAVNNQ